MARVRGGVTPRLPKNVLNLTMPPVGAVQVHHNDRPTALAAWSGLPASRVALRLLEIAVASATLSVSRLAKLSLLCAAAEATPQVTKYKDGQAEAHGGFYTYEITHGSEGKDRGPGDCLST